MLMKLNILSRTYKKNLMKVYAKFFSELQLYAYIKKT